MSEQKTLAALVLIETQPALLDLNYEQLQQALTERLAQYETVVSEDGVKDAKASATEINKLRGELAKRRKEAVREASGPVREFEERMKALEGQCDDARQTILDQVQRYEDLRRGKAEKLLKHLRDSEWQRLEVRKDHQKAEYADLVKISALTAQDNLTKVARDEVRARVAADRAVQDRRDRRVLELENRSYRAGLSAPLTADHVHQWLEAGDEIYEREVERILTAELRREEQARERMRAQMEREHREREAQQQAEEARRRREAEEAQRRARGKCDGNHGGPPCEDPECWAREHPPAGSDEAPAQRAQTLADDREKEEPPASGRVAVTITCTFETQVPAEVSDEYLESELRRKLARAGIKSLASVRMQRRPAAA